MPAPSPDTIKKAKIKFEQAKARFQALEARASTERRKLETRRKIILGALILDAVKSGNWPRDLNDLLVRINRDVDLKAFEDWNPKGDLNND